MAIEAGPTVLIVEDNDLVRDMCTTVLRESGRTVVATGDSDDALRLLDEGGFAVVVTDLSLPGSISGLDLVRTLCAREPRLGVVVTTGRLDEPGAVDPSVEVVMKPFGIDQLLAAVARAETRDPSA